MSEESVGRTNSEYATIVIMARRPDRKKAEMLSEDDLRELRHNLAHLLIYHRLPRPEQIQVLVQAWKQLWNWR
jgi:hypothetical protein